MSPCTPNSSEPVHIFTASIFNELTVCATPFCFVFPCVCVCMCVCMCVCVRVCSSHHALSRSARTHQDAQDHQPSWPWDPPHTRSYWTSTWTGQRTNGNSVYFLSHNDFVVFDASFNTHFACESSGACLWAHMCAPQGSNYPVSDTQACSDVIGLIIQWVLPSVCTPTVPDSNQSPPHTHTRTHTSKVLPTLSSWRFCKFPYQTLSLTHTHTARYTERTPLVL